MTPPRPAAERGMILLFTLIALAVLLVGGIALVRAMDTSLLQAGNLAFRRDLVNQAERAANAAVTRLSSGTLSTDSARESNLLTSNYSASRLASDGHGIPTLLLSDSAWTSAGMSAGDLTDSTTGVTLRWVIDRQCAAAGEISATNCVSTTATSDAAADDRYRKVNGEARPVYRISVRATGPRNTQAFFQTTLVR